MLRMIQSVLLLVLLNPVMAQVDYDLQIQPIFYDRCTMCHGNAGGLNLESYNNMLGGGNNGAVIVPGDHASSELYIRITLPSSSDEDMPPQGSLSEGEIDLIAQWIDEGALPEANCTYIEDQCYYNDDLAVIEELIILNDLDYSNVLEVGAQSWNNGRLFNWVLTYTPNGSNGVNQQLTVLPDNIGNLTNLGSLYLESNLITVLPTSFSALTNLSTLVINNNLLTSLPMDLGSLTNLFFLDLGYNHIEEIPESIGNLQNMMYLFLFNNLLTILPETICNIPLDWDGISGFELPYFASGGNQLCDSSLIPDCVENSANFEISLNQFYYSFLEYSPQYCQDDFLAGDINDDGILNVLDIVLMVNMILDADYEEVADMNEDGVINVLDIVTLINTILN